MQRLPIFIKIPLFLIFCLIIFSQKSFAQLDEKKITNQLLELNWHYDGTYQLNNGDATITVSSKEALVQGLDAEKFAFLSEGHKNFKPDAIIVRIFGAAKETQLHYSFHELGYLSTTDWEEHINKTEMLKEIRKNTAAANKIKKQGYANLYVDGWKQEPILDKTNSMVYWAISGHTDQGNKFVNAKAIKLARKGYTSITWIGGDEQFVNTESSLAPALTAYQYNEGYTYADYKPSIDKLAPIGVGALAYKMITGKSGSRLKATAGAGLLAMLAVFAKKLWFLIFIPFVIAGNWLKSLFTGGKDRV